MAGKRGATHGTLHERLDRSIDRSGGPDACWPWTGGGTTKGYGQLGAGGKGGRLLLTHRVVMERQLGRTLSWEECVLHRCDNPPCCNPDHLFLGDRQINVDDMMAKDRGNPRVGGDHGMAKLTDADVLEIRAVYTGRRGEQTTLARRFGVSPGVVSEIVNRKSWTHI